MKRSSSPAVISPSSMAGEPAACVVLDDQLDATVARQVRHREGAPRIVRTRDPDVDVLAREEREVGGLGHLQLEPPDVVRERLDRGDRRRARRGSRARACSCPGRSAAARRPGPPPASRGTAACSRSTPPTPTARRSSTASARPRPRAGRPCRRSTGPRGSRTRGCSRAGTQRRGPTPPRRSRSPRRSARRRPGDSRLSAPSTALPLPAAVRPGRRRLQPTVDVAVRRRRAPPRSRSAAPAARRP